jgi:hypothetical protein
MSERTERYVSVHFHYPWRCPILPRSEEFF